MNESIDTHRNIKLTPDPTATPREKSVTVDDVMTTLQELQDVSQPHDPWYRGSVPSAPSQHHTDTYGNYPYDLLDRHDLLFPTSLYEPFCWPPYNVYDKSVINYPFSGQPSDTGFVTRMFQTAEPYPNIDNESTSFVSLLEHSPAINSSVSTAPNECSKEPEVHSSDCQKMSNMTSQLKVGTPVSSQEISSQNLYTNEASDDSTFSDDVIDDEDEQFLMEMLPKKTTKSSKKTKRGCRLWEFIRDLLLDASTNPSIIRWENREVGTFRLVKSKAIARIWGLKKGNDAMNYEKLSRAMRYYYKRQVFQPVIGKRLVYSFGPRATGWRD